MPANHVSAIDLEVGWLRVTYFRLCVRCRGPRRRRRTRRESNPSLLPGNEDVSGIDEAARVYILSEVRRARILTSLLPHQKHVARVNEPARVYITHEHVHFGEQIEVSGAANILHSV